jgi:acyl-CoA thioesterase I
MSAMAPIKVTFFGDSTCVGQGVSLYKGWVTRVAAELHMVSKEIGRPIIVANSSINGRTTRQALEDMPYHIQSQGIDIIIIQFGLNDCNYWESDRGLPRVSKSAFIANLNEIIDRGLTFGAYKVLVNTNHPTSRSTNIIPYTNISYEDSNSEYNEAIREVCKSRSKDVLFQDVGAHFRRLIANGEKIEDLLLDDGLHLSERGHENYFNILYPAIADWVRRLASEGTGT